MKKKCELCKSSAKLFCESDQASLCWECDSMVHSANFLVTKHPRILLCHVCQSLTAWHGTGPKFVPTISVCDNCVTNNNDTCNQHNHRDGDDYDHDHGDEETGEDDTENDDDDVDSADEENQVVPWTSTPPPQVSSSSNTANTSTSTTRFSN